MAAMYFEMHIGGIDSQRKGYIDGQMCEKSNIAKYYPYSLGSWCSLYKSFNHSADLKIFIIKFCQNFFPKATMKIKFRNTISSGMAYAHVALCVCCMYTVKYFSGLLIYPFHQVSSPISVCMLWGCINVKTTKSSQVCAVDQGNARVKG